MSLKYVQIFVLAFVFALQFVAEHLYPQKRGINNWRNERFNLAIGVLNIALTFIPAAFFVQGIGFLQQHKLGLLHQFNLPLWLLVCITIFVMDFWMYVWHRANHEISFLWRFHRFHHKDTKMNTTTALRFHTAELLLSYPGKGLICFIFGISYLPLVIYEILFFTAVVIHHSNIHITKKQDALYRILFASPLMHRIHHSQRIEETDSNFGGLFSFWDKLFGSWKANAKNDIVFGLPVKDGDASEEKAYKK
ncbi:MAG: sterol desaturase family protein [Ginsengibacter sp.]